MREEGRRGWRGRMRVEYEGEGRRGWDEGGEGRWREEEKMRMGVG